MGTLVEPPDPPSLIAISSPQSTPLLVPQPQIGVIPGNPLQTFSISPQFINPNSQLPQEIPIIPPIQTKLWSSIFNVNSRVEEKENLEYVEPIFENGILQIEDEVLEEGMEEWKDKLVGYFVDEKVSPTLVKNFLKNRWKLLGEVEIKMDEELYYFSFCNKEDRDRVLEEGSIHISGKYFVICSWSENIEKEKNAIKMIPIWVKFSKLPKQLWNGKGLSRLASSIGKPMFMDKRTEEKKILAFARVFIEVQATKELPDTIHAKVSKTNSAIVNVEYSWKPKICIHCQTFGHESNVCSKNPSAVILPPQSSTLSKAQNQYQNNRFIMQNNPQRNIQQHAQDGYSRGRNRQNQNWREKERGEASRYQGNNVNTNNKFSVLLDCDVEEEVMEVERAPMEQEIGIFEKPIDCERQEGGEKQIQTTDELLREDANELLREDAIPAAQEVATVGPVLEQTLPIDSVAIDLGEVAGDSQDPVVPETQETQTIGSQIQNGNSTERKRVIEESNVVLAMLAARDNIHSWADDIDDEEDEYEEVQEDYDRLGGFPCQSQPRRSGRSRSRSRKLEQYVTK